MKKSVIIGGNTYNLTSPTIKSTELAVKCLGDIADKDDIYEILAERIKRLCAEHFHILSPGIYLLSES